MLFTEFNIDIAKEVWQEEAREDGYEEGFEEGRVEGREEGLKEGMAKARQEYQAKIDKLTKELTELKDKLSKLEH